MGAGATDTGLIPRVRKIAVLRANGIGDFVFTMPALEALRAAYPTAEIVLLGKSWHADFLADRSGPVDRVAVVPATCGVGEPEIGIEDLVEQDAFFARMVEERFDLALQLHGGGRHSNPFVRRLGARFTTGFKTSDADPLDRWIPYIYWQGEVVRGLEAVRLVGATPVVVAPRITVTDVDLAESRRVVPDHERPLVALNPGAGDSERRWPPSRFAGVGDALAGAGTQVVITGAHRDRPLAEEIRRIMHYPVEDLTGRLSLGGLAGLLSRCAVVISNDSGPLHMAAAVGAPAVGIYWCFNLVNAGPVETARHRPIISWLTTCPACGIDRAIGRCDHHPSFVADVPIGKVVEEALDLLRLQDSKTA